MSSTGATTQRADARALPARAGRGSQLPAERAKTSAEAHLVHDLLDSAGIEDPVLHVVHVGHGHWRPRSACRVHTSDDARDEAAPAVATTLKHFQRMQGAARWRKAQRDGTVTASQARRRPVRGIGQAGARQKRFDPKREEPDRHNDKAVQLRTTVALARAAVGKGVGIPTRTPLYRLSGAMPADSCAGGVHIAINSLASYATPRAKLLGELAAAGVPMKQVHVFLGDSPPSDDGREWFLDAESRARHYRVHHNSVDFTAMVHIVENPQLFARVRQWFYMHDTVSVGRHFWANATQWCAGLPSCALPLTRAQPTSSMGLYDADFLRRQVTNVTALKNARGASGLRWKQRGFGWEDKLFKVCDAVATDAPIRRWTRQCHNATLGRRTCICSQVQRDAVPQRIYGPESTPRQVWRYACADVAKYKANWARNRTMVIAP